MTETSITITVNTEDVLEEVKRLLMAEQWEMDQAAKMLDHATNDVAEVVSGDADLRHALISLENTRAALGKIDLRVFECLKILQGYYEMDNSDLLELQKGLEGLEVPSE